ncbi:hypothetical protein D3C86_1711470 [compost metagenome]
MHFCKRHLFYKHTNSGIEGTAKVILYSEGVTFLTESIDISSNVCTVCSNNSRVIVPGCCYRIVLE